MANRYGLDTPGSDGLTPAQRTSILQSDAAAGHGQPSLPPSGNGTDGAGGGAIGSTSPIGAAGPDGLTTQQRAAMLQSDAAYFRAHPATGPADNDVTIKTATQSVLGWTDISVGGGLEMMPATFDLGMTERYPGHLEQIVLKKGDACTVSIGPDLVITGWINRIIRKVAPNEHSIRVQGRSRCQDLIDCSAMPDEMSIVNVNVGDLARKLVAPFAGPIGVKLPDGNGSGLPYQFSVSLGQTPWELISQVATYEGLLVHDDCVGDLVICKVGTGRFASGFAEGQNLMEWQVQDSDEMLYSTYIPVLMAQDMLKQTGTGGNAAGAPVNDPQVLRYRPLIVISEQMVGANNTQFLAQNRAVWEATRRRGRSLSASVVADSWRDSQGALWTHNKLAPLDLPSCGITGVTWIIAGWQFKRDMQGTRAELTLMSPDAYSVQPSALNGVNFQIAQAVQASAIDGLNRQNPAVRAASAPNAGGGENGPRTHDGYGL